MRRTTWWAIGATALVVVAVGGTAWWLLSRPPGPQAAAEGYLSALADGDATGAARWSADDVPAADALAQAQEWISDPQVLSVDVSGEAATAAIRYTLGGEQRAHVMDLVQDGGWRVRDAFSEVTVATTLGDAVGLGPAVLPAEGDAVRVLPASYAVEALPAEILSGNASVVALLGEHEDVTVEAALAPGAADAVQERLDAYLAACTAESTTLADHCGLQVPWGADLESVTEVAFRVENTPRIDLSEDAQSFTASDGVFDVTVSGRDRDGATRSVTYRNEHWTVRGSLRFDGASLRIAVF